MDPSRFREDLRRFDPRLDFVWNGKIQAWQIVGMDRRQIRYLIATIPLGHLDRLGPQVIESLWACTPHRQGGAAEMNRRLDARADDEATRQDRGIAAALDEVAEGAYESLRRRDGMRVSNAGIPGVEIVDRRCTQEDDDGLRLQDGPAQSGPPA